MNIDTPSWFRWSCDRGKTSHVIGERQDFLSLSNPQTVQSDRQDNVIWKPFNSQQSQVKSMYHHLNFQFTHLAPEFIIPGTCQFNHRILTETCMWWKVCWQIWLKSKIAYNTTLSSNNIMTTLNSIGKNKFECPYSTQLPLSKWQVKWFL